MSKLISLKKASEILGVSKNTLRNWDNDGKLKSVKTIGGHRRYNEDEILNFLGKYKNKIIVDVIATYSCVSSHDQKQKGDLDRQSQRLSEYCAKKKYNVIINNEQMGQCLSEFTLVDSPTMYDKEVIPIKSIGWMKQEKKNKSS